MDISVKRRANTRAPNGVADRIVNQRRRPFAETRGRRNDLTRLPFVTSRAAGDKKSRRTQLARKSANTFPPRLAIHTGRQLSLEI